MLMEALEAFCRKFAPYVTGNWRENHLNIYIRAYEDPVEVACYGLGKANWRGSVEPYEPFYEELQAVLRNLPEGYNDVSAEFNCGRLFNVKLEVVKP